MARSRLAPTRANLLAARGQLARVRRGAQVVRRKRQALVALLFQVAKPAVSARAEIERNVTEAWPPLLAALAVHGRDGLRALSWPLRPLQVEIQPQQVWGVAVADIRCAVALRRTLDARGTVPGSTGPATMEAASRFEELARLLLQAATAELRVSRLAAAVSQTSQQLHVLEQRLEPSLATQISQVRRTLEEREREEHLVLKHLQRKREKQAPLMPDASPPTPRT